MPRLPFNIPAELTQAFGNFHPRYTQMGLSGHNGLDYALPDGTEVLAPDDGEVVEAGLHTGGFGYYVKLRTPAGEDWLLAHLHPWMLPRPGTWVAEGSLVGYSDNSGLSTGPHLHLGYRPLWWVRGYPYDGYADPLPLVGDAPF